MSRDSAQDTESNCGNNPQDTDPQEHSANDAADSAGVRGRSTGRIHRAGVDLLQVAIAHDPGDDSEDAANDDSEDAQDQDESASMWFHNSWLTPAE
jgi:hypothetical protein